MAREEAAREALAGYLGADPAEIALTDSTTMGLGLVYARMRLEPGDEVLTTEHDFFATHESLRLRERLDGVTVRRVRLYEAPEAASADEIASAIAGALEPRTRCVALTWVHSSSGVKLPLGAIAETVAAANRGRAEAERILLCVDGVHGFGVAAESPVELGVDVFVSGCHKWLFGPRGTGFVWARPAAWRRLAPTIPSFDPRVYGAWLAGRVPDDAPPGALNTPGGFHSFEHRWALPEAVDVHAKLGGRANVARRTVRSPNVSSTVLTRSTACACGHPATVSVGRPRLLRGCRRRPGRGRRHAEERHRVVASVTPYRTRYVRFGPSVANDTADVDRAIEAVARIAGRA